MTPQTHFTASPYAAPGSIALVPVLSQKHSIIQVFNLPPQSPPISHPDYRPNTILDLYAPSKSQFGSALLSFASCLKYSKLLFDFGCTHELLSFRLIFWKMSNYTLEILYQYGTIPSAYLMRKISSFCQSYLLPKPKSKDYSDTIRWPLLRLYVNEIQQFLIVFHVSKSLICCRFLQMQQICHRGSILVHIFLVYGLCICLHFHILHPKYRHFHLLSHWPKDFYSNSDFQFGRNGRFACQCPFSWSNQQKQFRRSNFQLRLYYCRKKPLSISRLLNQFNRLLQPRYNEATIGTAHSTGLQKCDCPWTSPRCLGKNCLEDLERLRF